MCWRNVLPGAGAPGGSRRLKGSKRPELCNRPEVMPPAVLPSPGREPGHQSWPVCGEASGVPLTRRAVSVCCMASTTDVRRASRFRARSASLLLPVAHAARSDTAPAARVAPRHRLVWRDSVHAGTRLAVGSKGILVFFRHVESGPVHVDAGRLGRSVSQNSLDC